MLIRPLGVLFALTCSSLVLSSSAGCGTTTSAPDTPSFDAGGADGNPLSDAADAFGLGEAGASQCPSGVCDYQAQSGCAAGQACRPQFTAAAPDVSPGCEAAGAGKSGAPCGSGSACAAGYYCADGACRKQCCARDSSACDSGESCFRQLLVRAGGIVIDSGMDLCFPADPCDPLDAQSCAAGLACTIVDSIGNVVCLPPGSALPGDTCSGASPCAAGALCGGDGKCRALCRAAELGGPPCPPGQGTCIHQTRDPVGIGECTPG